MTKSTHHLGSPDDTSMREYIITLKDKNDSDGFYEDMETEGGSITIPNRVCECCKRRPISRNTHYHLTYAEARQVLDDDRVLAVELTPGELGLKPVPLAWEIDNEIFDKKTASDRNDVNWGFVTSSSPSKVLGWTGGIADHIPVVTKSIVSAYSGKNVDVVIVDDGTPYPSTLEYQQNPDGTGYTRLIQYNWFKHSNELGYGANGTYDYSLGATTNAARLQEHGAHTMGTTAGNTQGWARDANIYFISFYDEDGSGNPVAMDYIRAFHNSKPINPETGVRNPTVVNNSWGYGTTAFTTASVSEIGYRGAVYTPTSGTAGNYVWDQTVLDNFWCTTGLTRVAGVDADFEDMVNDGIIVVASAGNSNSFMDVPGGPDYDNYFIKNGQTYYPHRGSSPGAATGVINVGAAGSHNELSGASIYTASFVEDDYYRAEFSNFGPRVDTWAAGAGIQSIWRAGDSLYDTINQSDARLTALGLDDTDNNNLKKCPGTSMSGPQVCGILACLAEAYPRMTNADALKFLQKKPIQTMDWTTGGRTDPADLGYSKSVLSETGYIGQWNPRYADPSLGRTQPFSLPGSPGVTPFRPDTGTVFPRSNKFYSKNTLSPSYALSVDNSSVLANGTNSATVTLTTTNIPDGTKIPYIITSKYKGAGKIIANDTGLYLASDQSNTYVTSITGTQFGDGDNTGTIGTEKRHQINMSVAGTNPTWVDDPAGFSSYDYTSAFDPNKPAAGAINITVTAPSTSAYVVAGTDRVDSNFSKNNGTIVVNYGDTLNFTINSGPTHPFYIKYSTLNGGASDVVNVGVTGQPGATSGVVSINTTQLVDSQGTPINQYGTEFAEIILYYQCGVHSGMRGMIIVRGDYPTFFDTTVQTGYFTGSIDDGYWNFPIPWNVPIFGSNQNNIYISTNSYVTFGAGSTAYNNLATLSLNKILLSAGDGRTNSVFHYIAGTAPNRYAIFDVYSYTTPSTGGETTYWQLYLYENDPNNIYVSVLANGRYSQNADRHPFYQSDILGGLDTTGVFTVNSNTATLTITPDASYTNPSDGGMNVNVRLGMYNTPDVDFTVTS